MQTFTLDCPSCSHDDTLVTGTHPDNHDTTCPVCGAQMDVSSA